MTHSILAPSSAGIWVRCPGSVLMELQYPEDTSTDEAQEGTLCHDAGQQMIEVAQRSGSDMAPYHTSLGPLSDEIVQAATMYADDVIRVMRDTRIFGGPNMGVEVRVECPRINQACFGTPDVWIWDPRERVLYLWDLKYGWGIVEAFENYQLMTYAAGLLELLGVPALSDDVRIEFTIVQPRAPHIDGPIRRWKTTAKHIDVYLDVLRESAANALGDIPECIPGRHCTNCRGRHACKALALCALDGADYAASPVPEEMGADAIGLELRLLENAAAAIKNRLTGVKGQVEGLIRRGERVPGWGMVEGRTNRKWLDDVQPGDLAAIGVPMKPVTPAQAEAAGVDKGTVGALVIKPPGAMKLKRDDGSRARMVFG